MIQCINSSYPLLPLLQFCNYSLEDTRPNAINMDPIDWENKNHTFLYCLYKEKRFDGPNSGYLVNIVNGEIVAGHGWYPSDWDNNIYVTSRLYTIPGYLKGLSVNNASNCNDLVWAVEDYAIQQGYKGGCFTFEKHNEYLADKSIRINNPKKYPDYRKVVVNGIVKAEYRKPGIRMREQKKIGPFIIKNTEQFVMYHLFDETYEKELIRKINEKTN